MPEKLEDSNVSRPSKMLYTECNPIDQPKGTYRYCLNGVNNTKDGRKGFISNENSNIKVEDFDNIIGSSYINDNSIAIFCVINNVSQIGILTKDDVYTPKIIFSSLGFDVRHQIDTTFRVRHNQKIVYWVDGNKNARSVNLSALYEHYTQDYIDWLNNGSIGPAPTQWNISSFELVKTYSTIPEFTSAKIINFGNVIPGSYSAAIRYLDSDLNPTNWITTSNIVNIYNDNLTDSYENIHGSRNTTTDAQHFTQANKSIQFDFDNLDTNYPFYQVAIIQSVSNTGKILTVLTTNPLDVNLPTYVYTGDDSQMTIISIDEIKLDRINIGKPDSIEQLENRLILANGEDPNHKWCEFQIAASQIKTDVDVYQSILNTVKDTSNGKNPTSTFVLRGFMPGEVYCFGIVYVMTDLSESPVFHIPGPPEGDVTTDMKTYELEIGYSDIHNCSGVSYWGQDCHAQPLLGKKVRLNRFPFRSQMPLATHGLVTQVPGTHNILNYRGTINIALIGTYPTLGGQPKVIRFVVRYKLMGIPSVFTKTLYLTAAAIGTDIEYYSGDIDIDTTFTQVTRDLDLGNFTSTFNPIATSVISTIHDAAYTTLFGIQFSNIPVPTGAIGFYIVRVERTDLDKLIIDNGIIGPNVTYNGYKSFSRFYPQIFPTTSMIPPSYITSSFPPTPYTQPQEFDITSSWLFNPEHQFFNKKRSISTLRVEGEFKPVLVQFPYSPSNMPDDWYTHPNHTTYQTFTIYNKFGLWNKEVQAGSKYQDSTATVTQPKFNVYVPYKVVDYRYDNNVKFDYLGININVDRMFFIAASDYFFDGTDTYYNATSDNKITIFKYDTDSGSNANILLEEDAMGGPYPRYDLNSLSTVISMDVTQPCVPPNYYNLLYVALVNEQPNVYADFQSRVYYKQHNNIIWFVDVNASSTLAVSLFSGDTVVSHHEPVASTYHNFHRKDDTTDKTWEIVAGVILLVGAVAVTVATVGAGAPLAVAAIGAVASTVVSTAVTLAVSYGVSLIQSGLKYENQRRMMETDYPNGMLECTSDVETFVLDHNPYYPDENTYMWYDDIMRNIYIESSVNVPLRSKLTASGTDFLSTVTGYEMLSTPTVSNFPFITLENYLREKFTTVDVSTGSGRLFRGYPMTEFYDMNLDYMRENHEKNFYPLPINYDCCDENPSKFPTRIWYSEQSFQEETTDNYRVFLPNNYRDVESEHGAITDLIRQGDELLYHTDESLWLLPKNLQERVTGQIVSFIGTGTFFSVPPKLIQDDTLGTAGSQCKWGTTKAKSFIFFATQKENKVFLVTGEGLEEISKIGNETFFKENLKSFFNEQWFNLTGNDYPNNNNPANKNGIGILSTYDNFFNRFILTKKDYLIIEGISLVIIATIADIGTDLDTVYYVEDTGLIFANEEIFGEIFTYETALDNPFFFQSCSWTISFDINEKAWVSLHSYLPNNYFRNQNDFFSFRTEAGGGLFKHNVPYTYQIFYGNYSPFIIEYISVSNPLTIRNQHTIELNTEARRYISNGNNFIDLNNISFTHGVFSNRNQSTGLLDLVVKDNVTPTDRYMQQQLVNTAGSIIISNRENYWRINDIRNYVTNYGVPLFILGNYGNSIDKTPNPSAISTLKTWYETEVLKDTFMAIRLYLNDGNLYNVNLTMKYSIEKEVLSER